MTTVSPLKQLPHDHPLATGLTSGSALVSAAYSREVPHTPVWFMRQAGRSLPEYRTLREGVPMMTACFDPELITEITLQPVRRHGVDAAIFFSDIVVPLKAIGVDLDIVPGVGPVVANPIRAEDGVASLRALEPDDVTSVLQAVGLLTGELGATPLIGFAGAPFTLASYLIEGGPSKDHSRTKSLMVSEPGLWHALADRLAHIAGAFLALQVEAGASAVQLFDSWVGSLPERDYREFVLPHSQTALSYVTCAPRIHFGVGTGELLPAMSEAGTEVMGVDFRISLSEADARLGGAFSLQGNLDPALLFAAPEAVAQRVDRVLTDAQGLGGHIFNLGHGVLPSTDPGILTDVVSQVHDRTRRG